MSYNKAKEITLKNFKLFKSYETFMAKSSQEEFARSQIPFYYAVKAFPQILCLLASKIEDPEVRLHIAENIWEEHGNGSSENFHINTFKKYLTSIAGSNFEFAKNPWVEEWIDGWFATRSPLQLACKLAAIEYLYAPISGSISEHIETLSLYNEQHHYSKHAELDWEHGRELFEVALNLNGNDDESEVFKLFDQAQKEFINVFNGMTLFTEKDANMIAKEGVAFYYIREESDISKKSLTGDDHKNIISICSGGEGIIKHLTSRSSAEIALLDMNQQQMDVLDNKLNMIADGDEINENTVGKFENMFSHIRERIKGENVDEDGKIQNKDKMRFIIEDIFTRKNLSIIFTDNAVKYTAKDFADHFSKVFLSDFEKGTFGYENIRNIMKGTPFSYPKKEDLRLDNKKIVPVLGHIHNEDLFLTVTFTNGKKADLIDLSNIGDWIELDDLRKVIVSAKKMLAKDGTLIMRKLLGDYILKDEIESAGMTAVSVQDSSLFYEETVLGKINEQ